MVVQDLLNQGNNSMLQGAMNRFAKSWPDAFIEDITYNNLFLQPGRG
jgi:hypothetical protein